MRPNLHAVPELGEPQSTDRRPTLTRVLAAVIVTLLAGAILFARPMPASAESNADEAQFFALLNSLRARLQLPPLVSDAQATNVARVWSSKLASDGALSHNPNLASQVSDWKSLGENVGTGATVASIQAALEASPHHYENMTDPSFNYVGIGVVEVGSTIWLTQVFKQSKSGLPGVAVPAPAPAPKAAPKPAPTARPPSPAPRPAAAPARSTAARNPAAPPAAAAGNAATSGPTDAAASAPSAPGPSPVTGPESANGSPLPRGLAVVSPIGMSGPRLASLALFGILCAITLLATRGILRLPVTTRRK